MKSKLIKVSLFFVIFIILSYTILYMLQRNENPADTKEEQIVALNEIGQLAKSAVIDHDASQLAILEEKVEILQDDIRNDNILRSDNSSMTIGVIMCSVCLLFIMIVFGYVYFTILHPFERMKSFAEKIAHGNFDIPLDYERSNYFGAFTWAFDSMRKEIIKARSCEHEAIENNKTIIATLSHDIKSPVASIRAYAEGLEANLDKNPEKRAKFLNVIIRKCDDVAKLTNDLFLHSISDLDKLKIVPEYFELCGFLKTAVSEISAEQGDVTFKNPIFTAEVMADKNRLVQIAENLINNSRKYAKTRIDISMELDSGNVLMHFRDYGKGIPDEDMPFIFDKFYKGRNCGNEQGSGLGLYIVKYIAIQMDGQILLRNHADGLQATIIMPVKNNT